MNKYATAEPVPQEDKCVGHQIPNGTRHLTLEVFHQFSCQPKSDAHLCVLAPSESYRKLFASMTEVPKRMLSTWQDQRMNAYSESQKKNVTLIEKHWGVQYCCESFMVHGAQFLLTAISQQPVRLRSSHMTAITWRDASHRLAWCSGRNAEWWRSGSPWASAASFETGRRKLKRQSVLKIRGNIL